MYPPMIDPQLMRFQQMFGAMQGNSAPVQQNPMPERLGATEPLGGLPQVIDPSMIGSEAIPQTPEQSIAQRLQELYSPETSANDRLTQLLNQFPERNNPGVLAKIVGSLIGGARGPEAADRAMYGPYEREVRDWERQIRPAEHLASQERYNNQNERQFANQVITSELNERKFGQKVDNDAKTQANRERRTRVYEWKAQHPNQTIKLDKNGNFVAINPQTLKTEYITDADGKPISGREISWEDKQNILQENALERIDRSAEVGLNRIPIAGAEARVTKAAPNYDDLNPENDNDISPSQQKVARENRASAFIADNPDLADWIQSDGTIEPPSEGGWFSKGRDKNLYKAIVDHIVHGKPFVRPEPTEVTEGRKVAEGVTQNTSVINKNNGKLPEGKIKVISPDGVVGYIPMNRLDAYLAGGYKKVN